MTKGQVFRIPHPSYPSRLDTTRWLYDHATGLLTNKVYADGNGTAYTYAPSGRMATRTWARGVITSYGYDTLGQLVSVDYSDGTPDVTNAYDRLGRKISALSAVSTNLFDYNQDTYLYKETQNNDTLTRAYTAAGQPYATGVNDKSNYYDVWELYGPYEFAEIYDYDEFGRNSAVISVHSLDAEWSNYAITGFGYQYLAGSDQIESVIGYADQYWESYAPPISRVVSRDPRRGVITGVSNFWNAAAVSSYTYQNDALGRRTARADVLNASGVPVEIANAFGYNQRSEVTEATMGTNIYGYVYDPIGNRLHSAVAVGSGQSATTNTYVANALNQYTNILCASAPLRLIYDADGNLISDGGGWHFFWDAENRLILASNATTLVRNTYDHRSRRIRKEVSVWDPQLTAYRSQSTASFLWDNWNVIREVQHSNIPSFLSSTNYYTWGVDLSGSLQGAGGVGGLLSVTTTDTNSGTSTNYYPVYDANGNVTAYLDAGGSAVARYEYDAFGNAVNESVQEGRHLPFRFSTKYWDAEMGLSYYGYRYYHSELGRWLSRDPIGEISDINIYMALANNINCIDLFGLDACILRTIQNPWVEYGTTFTGSDPARDEVINNLIEALESSGSATDTAHLFALLAAYSLASGATFAEELAKYIMSNGLLDEAYAAAIANNIVKLLNNRLRETRGVSLHTRVRYEECVCTRFKGTHFVEKTDDWQKYVRKMPGWSGVYASTSNALRDVPRARKERLAAFKKEHGLK